MIVDIKSEGALRLFSKKNRGSEKRFERTNETLGEHAINVVLEGFELGF